jgi:hypothetical protein
MMDMASNMNCAGNILIPEVDVSSEVLAVNYNRFFAIGDRFAKLWATGIYGSVDGNVSGLPLGTSDSGWSDPYFALRIGLVGAPALKAAEIVRHKQEFQLYALG